jgi:hypothetical protein
MNKIRTRIPTVKFFKHTSLPVQKTAAPNSPRIVKNGAIKPPQPTLQTETYRGPVRKHNEQAIKIVNHFAKTAAADIKQSIPLFYHPDFEPSSLILPKDRIEINSWCNYFYKYDALVATAIDMHAELPLSKIRLDVPKIANKKLANRILEHYVDMIGNNGIDLFNKLLMMGVEYYKIGNVFPWAQMNTAGNAWERLICLNPDYLHIEKLSLTNAISINLVPDDRLRHIVHAGPYDEKTGLLYQTLSDDVIEKVSVGKEIPLPTDPADGSHVAHLARKLADYAEWGTSIIERNFKTLVYKDRLRQSQDAIAARHLTPKHLIWAEFASRADVNEIRDQVEDAMLNPDSAVVTNYQLHWELIGTSSGLMQLATEYEWITEDLLVGLMINKNILLGEGAFASGQSVLEVLNQRYAIFREILENYIERNLFIPIARNNNFIEYTEGLDGNKKEHFIFPHVRWNRLNLTDDTQHKQMLAQAVNEGKVDVGTWLEYFGLNSDTIAQRLKTNEDTVLDPSYNELRRSIMMEVGRTLGPAIAKVYADAYGVELEDQGGGMSMFGSSKIPIVKFGKDFNIDYDKEGNICVTPKMVIEEHEIPKSQSTVMPNITTKTAETREEREQQTDRNKEDKRHDDITEKMEVKPIEKLQKPQRKDMKSMPKIFGMIQSLERQFSPLKKEADDGSDEVSGVDVKASSNSAERYGDSNLILQSPEKIAFVRQKSDMVNGDTRQRFQQMAKLGVNQHTRQLTKTAENDIVAGYYRLLNSVKDRQLEKTALERVKQIYTGLYHSLVGHNDTIFNASQIVKESFGEEINKQASKLVERIELISNANRKIASKSKPEQVASKSHEVFQKSEGSVRKAVREIVDKAMDDIRGFAS